MKAILGHFLRPFAFPFPTRLRTLRLASAMMCVTGIASAAPFTDTNGDGVPDGWEWRPSGNKQGTTLALENDGGALCVHLIDRDGKAGVGMARVVPVVPGKKYRQVVELKGGSLAVFFNWMGSDRKLLPPENVKTVSATEEGYAKREVEMTAPPGAAYCLVWHYSSTGNQTETRIRDAIFEEVPVEIAALPSPDSVRVPAPSGDAFLAGLRPSHPRLLLTPTRVARIKALAQSDANARAWMKSATASAAKILSEPVATYSIPDGLRLLDTSKKVERRVSALGLAWSVSGDERYARRALDEMRAVCAFPDWNTRHFLDTAEMALAVGLAYDWFHAWLGAEDRALMKNTLVRFALAPGLDALEGRTPQFWAKANNNWNVICNGGLAVAALAIAEEEPDLARRLLPQVFTNVQSMLQHFDPDGAWFEGTGYWWGTVKYTVDFLSALESACGSDFGLVSRGAFPGFLKTGLFPIHLVSPTGMAFNFSDSGEAAPVLSELFWLASKTGQGLFLDYARAHATGAADDLIFYEPLPAAAAAPLPSRDAHFRGMEVAALRGAWGERGAAYVALKAGDNSAPHGHLDLGSIVFDALGVRWFGELGSGNYNAPGYFGAERWSYYKVKTEGHNTLVLDPSRNQGGNQDPKAVAKITRLESAPDEALLVADLSKAWPGTGAAVRGVKLWDGRRRLLVQDEVRLERPVVSWWFMHTKAQISLLDGGRQAMLSLGAKRLNARLLSPGGSFVVMDAAPLPETPVVAMQDKVTGVQKLALRFEGAASFTIAVLFTPLEEGETVPAELPMVEPISAWKVVDRTSSFLDSIAVNGVPLEGFRPECFAYGVIRTSSAKPVVSAKAKDPACPVKIWVHDSGRFATVQCGTGALQCTTVLRFVDANETPALSAAEQGPFKLPAPPSGVWHRPSTVRASSAQDENPAQAASDLRSGTRWSAEGDGAWLEYDFGKEIVIEGAWGMFFKGNERKSRFELVFSADGKNFATALRAESTAGKDGSGFFKLPQSVKARYARYIGHGHEQNAWNSVVELAFYGP